MPNKASAVSTHVPWSDRLTAYDREHLTTYLRLLDAWDDEASVEEMAQEILGIDPWEEPVRARDAVRSHLDRVVWLLTTGSKELFKSWPQKCP
ncbi:DUF2285 domain-containing protein [Mesorhizobium ciceri]|uniref:DUF2285 domain-containing protein n=1 Tax=Mesorhizobium ciceri TaxID=39645 RepID=UPI0007A93BB2|nr:DUF2285 domain-containing protein [Mesorhizobium ciceri]AMY00710.1 hypothetical protein A4R29_15305 [Mesorhizobium ciceri biovar biserrulae]